VRHLGATIRLAKKEAHAQKIGLLSLPLLTNDQRGGDNNNRRFPPGRPTGTGGAIPSGVAAMGRVMNKGPFTQRACVCVHTLGRSVTICIRNPAAWHGRGRGSRAAPARSPPCGPRKRTLGTFFGRRGRREGIHSEAREMGEVIFPFSLCSPTDTRWRAPSPPPPRLPRLAASSASSGARQPLRGAQRASD